MVHKYLQENFSRRGVGGRQSYKIQLSHCKNLGLRSSITPMQLEEDLLFEPHGPKLKTHWMSLKDSAISEIPNFPSCNDEDFHEVRKNSCWDDHAQDECEYHQTSVLFWTNSNFCQQAMAKGQSKKRWFKSSTTWLLHMTKVIIRLHVEIPWLRHFSSIFSLGLAKQKP